MSLGPFKFEEPIRRLNADVKKFGERKYISNKGVQSGWMERGSFGEARRVPATPRQSTSRCQKWKERPPWRSSGEDPVLRTQGAQVRPLVGELRSHMLLQPRPGSAK